MKKILTTLLVFSGLHFQGKAQACGESFVCTAPDTLTQPGLSSIVSPLLVRGSTDTIVVQYMNFDSLHFGNNIGLDSLRIVSIGNLPEGLCWATDRESNTFGHGEQGCIRLTGTISCNVAPGQYNLNILVSVWLSDSIEFALVNAQAEPIFYFIRVVSANDSCEHPLDTTDEYIDSIKYYIGNSCLGPGNECLASAINEVSNYLSSLNIAPNPVNSEATVTFNSTRSDELTERITDILGNVISTSEMQVEPGLNTRTIQRGHLPAGIYFYTLGNGQSSYTKKLIVDE